MLHADIKELLELIQRHKTLALVAQAEGDLYMQDFHNGKVDEYTEDFKLATGMPNAHIKFTFNNTH